MKSKLKEANFRTGFTNYLITEALAVTAKEDEPKTIATITAIVNAMTFDEVLDDAVAEGLIATPEEV